MNPRRRTVLAALLAGAVGVSTQQPLRGYLDRFASLSGDAWDAATATVPDTVATPYGNATVTYDSYGVPTVEAETDDSLYYAIGYVHGTDRLFQMDLFRRRMRGELSAVFGERTVSTDVFHVQMDFVAAAEANWEVVGGTSAGDAIEVYAEGVNEVIENEPLPLEFQLLSYEPAPWSPVDSMLIEKQLGWGLTGSFETLRRANVAEEWGSEIASLFFPRRLDHDSPILRRKGGIDADGPTTTPMELAGPGEPFPRSQPPSRSQPQSRSHSAPPALELTAWLSGFESPDGVGSNSWVVSANVTESGKPLLANDPHLTLLAPPIWYEMHQRTDDVSVGGVSFPGEPFVVIGETDAGAWGFTNAKTDTIDFYRHDDAADLLAAETKTVEVAGGEDREVTVRKTEHGPVLERAGAQVSVAWAGFTASRTTEAVYELDRNDGVEDAIDAIKKFDQPTQNFVYADSDGNTHYHVTGLIPIRLTNGEPVRGDQIFDGSAADEGVWPGYEAYGVPNYDEGWIPFEEKPHSSNFDYLATANQRIIDDDAYEYYLAESYGPPWRAARIYDLLDERAASDEPLDFAYQRRIQRDVVDRRATLFVPAILGARDSMSERARDAADELADWDYHMDRDSYAALVFAHFVEHYRHETFGLALDAVGFDDAYYPSDWVLLHLEPDSEWFGDPPVGPPRARTRVIAAAMDETVTEIDDQGWHTYGDYNVTDIDHPFDLGFLNYPHLPTDGSPATVRNFRKESQVGSSYRLLARFDGFPSENVIPGGNDGDYFSKHYADQLEMWANGEYKFQTATTDGDPDVTFTPPAGGGDDGV